MELKAQNTQSRRSGTAQSDTGDGFRLQTPAAAGRPEVRLPATNVSTWNVASPAAPGSTEGWRRPVLEIDDLDARPEWDGGRDALLEFINELNLPSPPADQHGKTP